MREKEELDSYFGNKSLKDWKLRRLERHLLHMLGFGIFANPRVVLATDTNLISTLVESWITETNTFFTSQGKMTVTLDDVSFILGLPIQRDALTCRVIENKARYFVNNWFETLTEENVEEALYQNNIKLSWLFDRGLENAAKKGSKTIACCTWLLQVWAYERFTHIGVLVRDPGLEDNQVAEGCAYATHQGITKMRGKGGSHHNLPFYRGELDGVADD
ncbi:hypothetical protein AgCh_015940 [Apium graveolens]